MRIKKVEIENYKSIRRLELELGDINILIGSNGAGKSNFISYFKLLNRLKESKLQQFVARNGGADNLLYFGRKTSAFLGSRITIAYKDHDSQNYHQFRLEPSQENSFYFGEEEIGFWTGSDWYTENLGTGQKETRLFKQRSRSHQTKGHKGVAGHIINAFSAMQVYHFHDTSESAGVKQFAEVHDNQYLREDASNLAAFLYWMQETHPIHFKQIETSVRLIAPFFDHFDLKPNRLNENQIQLEWKEVGSDKYFNGHNLSDGSLRMICLLTLFLQPEPPSTIIVDEPELGLHPSAINLLASLIRKASRKAQIILSTQSTTLINCFEPQHLIIVDRKDGQSVFRRIEEEELKSWAEEYSMGEIWEKNLIGGRP